MSLLVLIPVSAFASFDKDLFYGSTGQSVIELQDFLQDQGFFKSESTGNFYALTQSAVKRFQAANSISPASGYFGPKSRAVANTTLSVASNEDDEGAAETQVPGTFGVASEPDYQTITLPNGSVVHVDKNGNISQWVTPQPVSPTIVYVQPQITQTQVLTPTLPINIDTTAPVIKKLAKITGENYPFTWKNGNTTGNIESTCTNCIFIETNEPTKVTFRYQNDPSYAQPSDMTIYLDGAANTQSQSVETAGYGTRHVLTLSPNSVVSDEIMTSNIANKAIVTPLNLNSTQTIYWIVEVTDEAGNVGKQDFVYPHTWSVGQKINSQ